MANVLKKVGLLAGSFILLIPAILSATPPPPTPHFAGKWQMNAAQSQLLDDRVMNLEISEVGDKLKFSFAVTRKNGSEVVSSFVCVPTGADCDFQQDGHKSKVSVWYSGSTLNVCKTNGLGDDVVSEWKLERSPDTKTLTLTISHITPEAKDEVLVFDRKPAD